jgi:hypothetical protein
MRRGRLPGRPAGRQAAILLPAGLSVHQWLLPKQRVHAGTAAASAGRQRRHAAELCLPARASADEEWPVRRGRLPGRSAGW